MKKNTLLPTVAIITILLIFVCIYSGIKGLVWLFFLTAIVIIFELYFFLGYYTLRKYKKNMLINPKDDIKRNYDRLIVGDASAIIETNDNALCLTSFHSSFVTDCEIIKRYYSFVKKGGSIDLFINRRNKSYFDCMLLDPFSYDLLHNVTLFENGINRLKYYQGVVICAIKFPIYSIFRNKHHTIKCDNKDSLVIPITDFCNERMITLNIYR